MAIQDSIPVTTLERTVSNDFVQAQALLNRQLAEVVASLTRTIEVTTGGTPPTSTVRSHVASGLQIDAAGGITVYVRPGILIQNVTPSPPSVPTPDTFDSSYRFGLLMSAEDVTDPWDGTSAFWLLEARVVRETTLSEKRDIFNTATLTFALSAVNLDKRYESQIEFQWTKGTATDIPAHTAGWAPIGWCYRAAGGGAISESDVGSMSIQLEDIVPASTDLGRANVGSYFCQTDGGIGRASGSILCDFQAEVGGYKVVYKNDVAVTIKSSTYTVAADVAALTNTGTIGYIYIAPLPDAIPSKVPFSGAASRVRGVLVLSRTAPDDYGTNSGNITPPAPFTNYVIPAGTAAHVGIIRSNGVGSAIEYVHVTKGGVGTMNARLFNNNVFPLQQGNSFVGPAGPSYNLAVLGPGGTEDVPYGVDLRCFIRHGILDAAATAKGIEIAFGMGPALVGDDTATPGNFPGFVLDTDVLQSKEFELHPMSGDLTLTLAFVPRNASMANTGGGAADGGATVLSAGYYGFRF